MPALNYQPQWADRVASGTKPHTIRATRKRPFKVGDRLIHYQGMRTKKCTLLGESISAVVMDVEIDTYHRTIRNGSDLLDADAIARADGFDSLRQMMQFFSHRQQGWVFYGQLVAWESIVTPGGLLIPCDISHLH